MHEYSYSGISIQPVDKVKLRRTQLALGLAGLPLRLAIPLWVGATSTANGSATTTGEETVNWV